MIKLDDLYPIYFLDDNQFPNPYLDYKDGLAAISYDLDVEKLLNGYSNGFFPWFEEDGQFFWYQLSQRMVLYTNKVTRTKNLNKKLRSNNWDFSVNQKFENVIKNCAEIKRPIHMGEGTWITQNFIDAYTNLHKLGYALSVESYYKGELVGGFYGVGIGKYFSGESMFAKKSDASKLALIYFCELCQENGIEWIDCQSGSDHLLRMGAEMIPKTQYLDMLNELINKDNK